MLLIVVLGLIAKLASVSAECDVAKTVQDFDFNKFTGTWYFMLHLSTGEDDQVECPTDYYCAPAGNGSKLITKLYDKNKRSDVIENGFVSNWNNTGLTFKYDKDLVWNGRLYILAVDYDIYFIGAICSDRLDEVLIYVAFRSAHPNNATMEDMKKALCDNNIDFNQLKDWNADRCRDVSVEC